MFLPIKFSNEYSKTDSKYLTPENIITILEQQLNFMGFNYVKRKANKLSFHTATLIYSNKHKDYLGSGVIKVSDIDGKITVENGNWLILTIIIPLIITLGYVITESLEIPILDSSNTLVLSLPCILIFSVLLIGRFVAHQKFKRQIHNLITTHLVNKA